MYALVALHVEQGVRELPDADCSVAARGHNPRAVRRENAAVERGAIVAAAVGFVVVGISVGKGALSTSGSVVETELTAFFERTESSVPSGENCGRSSALS